MASCLIRDAYVISTCHAIPASRCAYLGPPWNAWRLDAYRRISHAPRPAAHGRSYWRMRRITSFHLRLVAAVLSIALGIGFGTEELLQRHWFAAAGWYCSGVLAAGLFVAGFDFIRRSVSGAALAVATAVLAVYAFFFENRAFDVELDHARSEVAVELVLGHAHCGAKAPRTRIEQVARICRAQPGRDRLAAAGEGIAIAHVPPVLDFPEKLIDKAQGEAPDDCQAHVRRLHADCPAAFATVDSASLQTILRER